MSEEPEDKKNIKEEIDTDEGLRSKRNLLSITSLILLAIQFSGAKIEEANTFILKLSFEHQNGVGVLLVLAIIFLLVRYYNYARPYHDKLYKEWSSRMLKEPLFYCSNPHTLDADGLIINLAGNLFDIDRIRDIEHGYWESSYSCHWIFVRGIHFDWCDENCEQSSTVPLLKNLSILVYLKILRYELIYQVSSIFSHRENLDIYSPYILGILSISSYFFNEQLQSFINLFLTK